MPASASSTPFSGSTVPFQPQVEQDTSTVGLDEPLKRGNLERFGKPMIVRIA